METVNLKAKDSYFGYAWKKFARKLDAFSAPFTLLLLSLESIRSWCNADDQSTL